MRAARSWRHRQSELPASTNEECCSFCNVVTERINPVRLVTGTRFASVLPFTIQQVATNVQRVFRTGA